MCVMGVDYVYPYVWPTVSFLDEDEQKDVTVRAFPRNEGN
jgi:hypothetical protein